MYFCQFLLMLKERKNYMQTVSKPISLKNTAVTGGFWADKQKLNREVTIHSVYNRFKDTGRFDAFKLDWKDGDPNQPHIFWDSDIAKWLESAAYITDKTPSPDLEKIIDEVVDLIEKNRWDDGYFNICYTLFQPEDRFTARYDHELYCAGHLLEGAIAYFETTGKRQFLSCMEKYMAYIRDVFMIKQSASFVTPGHQEIELALLRLYRLTGDEKALELAFDFDRKVLVEQGLNKPLELNCSVLGYNGESQASEIEMPVTGGDLLSYMDKYGANGGSKGMASLKRVLPAPIEPELRERIQKLSVDIFNNMDCKGVVRIDYMYDAPSNGLYITEINTLPGSMAFYLWEATGLPYAKMIDKLVEFAMQAKQDKDDSNYAYSSDILKDVSLGGKAGPKNGAKL